MSGLLGVFGPLRGNVDAGSSFPEGGREWFTYPCNIASDRRILRRFHEPPPLLLPREGSTEN